MNSHGCSASCSAQIILETGTGTGHWLYRIVSQPEPDDHQINSRIVESVSYLGFLNKNPPLNHPHKCTKWSEGS